MGTKRHKPEDVIDVLADLFSLRGVPKHIRSDNGPEFIAKSVQAWIAAVGAETAYIAPGAPWENGHVESFDARLRDELLDGEVFHTLKEAQIIIEGWRRHYNTVRPHGALGYRPPVPEVFVPALTAWPAALARPAPPAKPEPCPIALQSVPALARCFHALFCAEPGVHFGEERSSRGGKAHPALTFDPDHPAGADQP